MDFWLYQLLNGLSFGMLLFLLSAGLALIFGVMRILNLAHGVFYAFGVWVAIAVYGHTNSFWLALLAGIGVVTLIGIFIERVLLRRIPHDELPQALMTFGLMLIIGDLALWIWGGTPQTLPRPEWLAGPIQVADYYFPAYRVFMIVVGIVIGALLWYVQSNTRVGALIRAAIDDAEIAQSTGINVSLLSTATFAIGAALAAFGGIVGGPILGVHVGLELEVLLLAFVVVIIGGLGSLKGAFVGAIIVGMLDSLGKTLIPEFALFTLFVPMALILIFRPNGLMGGKA
ncbi:branched-chain amino acid ABC transporter permease [Pusillimonas sp. T2]|uniref:branched-chain amino acid ABC transporter permease n=1 Tax=Pusillimonas sp. T2 TaxID=1548123 RepID=UPI000B9CB6FC|nr:branched-chain amino acid ABC transporter permease [Pusillimonas sp. T2]OXR48224.1 branched-chain amino acid ABC transporter permease [Pusillimonas sp. T2]